MSPPTIRVVLSGTTTAVPAIYLRTCELPRLSSTRRVLGRARNLEPCGHSARGSQCRPNRVRRGALTATL